jgi:protein phosphatase 2C family protein 2/3
VQAPDFAALAEANERFSAKARGTKEFVLEFGVKRVVGSRNHQEDEYTCLDNLSREGNHAYFAIFDGHGSDTASAHASRHLHEILFQTDEFKSGDYPRAIIAAFAREDQLLERKSTEDPRTGCTATAAVIANGFLFVGNAGDSRAVLGCEEAGAVKAYRLSRDHKPDDPDEKARIEEAGGVVARGRVQGIHSAINMSRALGDMEFKLPRNAGTADHITWVPHLCPAIPLDRSVKFLILASDGLWNVFEDQQVVNEVHSMLSKGMSPEQVSDALTKKVSETPHADNTTVITVVFKWGVTDAPSGKKQKVSGIEEPGSTVA